MNINQNISVDIVVMENVYSRPLKFFTILITSNKFLLKKFVNPKKNLKSSLIASHSNTVPEMKNATTYYSFV